MNELNPPKAGASKRTVPVGLLWAMALAIACAYGSAQAQAELSNAKDVSPLPQLGNGTSMVESTKPWTRAQKEFNDARFGLFLHWGLYSQSAGEWKGKRFYGISEWMVHQLHVPMRDYAEIAGAFNPTDFDAERWVAIAKDSGIKYIVITAKHHDGFSMYDSKISDFNIVSATPFKRDPIKELVAAAHSSGLKIGFYYSQTQDWVEPNAVGNDWDYPKDGRDFKKYYYAKAVPQIKELLSNYGPIDIIWFDTPMNISRKEASDLYKLVKKMQPDCLVNSRLGQGLGDFQVFGDGEIPSSTGAGVPWEAIFTHNDSWGFRAADQNFKSTEEILRLLVTSASRGGNLLMNIGPDAKGAFPPVSVARFKAVGDWLKTNGESIYGTSGSTLGPMPWGLITQRPGKLYLHVFDRPSDGKLIVHGFTGEALSVSFLANGQKLDSRREGSDLIITMGDMPDQRDSVIEVNFSGAVKKAVDREIVVQRTYPSTVLMPPEAQVSGGLEKGVYTHSYYFGEWRHIETFKGFTSASASALWKLHVVDPGDYRVSLRYMASGIQAGREGWLEGPGDPIRFEVLQTTDGYNPLRPAAVIQQDIGLLHFEKPGEYSIRLRSDASGVDMFMLQDIRLTPND